MLTGLRAAPEGEVQIEVRFNISADGIVSVAAKDMETGKEQSITVTATSGLTENEIHQMIRENEDYLMALREDEVLERERDKLMRLTRDVEQLAERFGGIANERISELVDRARVEVGQARAQLSSRDLDEVARRATALEEIQTTLSSLA